MKPVNEASALLFYNLCQKDTCIAEQLAAHSVSTLQEFRGFLVAVVQQTRPDENAPGSPPPTDGDG